MNGAQNGTLHRVADVLGVSAERLRTDSLPTNLSGAAECLRLWQEIESEAGMRQALACLRRIARDEKAARSQDVRKADG